jgi:hypothetical protein
VVDPFDSREVFGILWLYSLVILHWNLLLVSNVLSVTLNLQNFFSILYG